ncbi:Rhs element Vgr protein [Paraburkholderia lycopersici]|uniref:Rhs element Vgr protein n=1 Tax=Paraburkholderia lycopersici TaxID=416944 RepID=A0A1G6Q0R7_9BURK|nr:Rhs element Vgr protein [Paraburkholderia lycopersici]
MFKPLQARTLSVASDALPTRAGQAVLIPQRVRGAEALGNLFDYRLELATLDSPTCRLSDAQPLVVADQLIGKSITISIEFEGKGTFVPELPGNLGAANAGAGVRTIEGLITSVASTGSDDRRAYYELTVRPWLWLATQNCESRIYQNVNVVEVTGMVLKGGQYPWPHKLRLGAVGLENNVYPQRDYIRQYWESDYDFLTRIWREWGIYYLFDGMTLVLCDSPGSHKKHNNAYDTVRYHAPDGKRIDEEHIHRLTVSRQITAGDVTLNDYDYTRSLGKFDVNQSQYSKSALDNIGQYHWGEYSQPLAGAMGLSGEPNDYDTEGAYLARVRVNALRCRRLRACGSGNLRGLTTGKTFRLEGHPQREVNTDYLVVSTSLDVRNPDEITQSSGEPAQYRCVTDFVLQPASAFFKNRLRKKPQAHAETAVVVGPANQPVWLDGYARTKVSFLWDRRSSRDENSSCWVRAGLPWHGGPHSFIAVPRIGDELTIDYHEGDPDKPYISASKVNEFNQPPFDLPKNQALTGLVSHSLQGNGHNYVVTDDTPGQLQVQVASDQASSRLVLGYSTRIDYGTGRQQARGLGWELATNAWGVLRANLGMYLTTQARDGAAGPAKDMCETVGRLQIAQSLHDALTQVAQKSEAQDADGHQSDIVKTIAEQNEQIRGAGSDSNTFPELSAPHVLIDGKAGVEITTPATVHVAAQQAAITTEGHIGIAGGRSLFATVRDTIRLFAQTSPIHLVAAAGDIVLNALTKSIVARAQNQILLESEDILLRAKKFRVEVDGSFLNMDSAGIVSGTTGKFLAHASVHGLPGPKDQMVSLSPKQVCIECLLKAAKSGSALVLR